MASLVTTLLGSLGPLGWTILLLLVILFLLLANAKADKRRILVPVPGPNGHPLLLTLRPIYHTLRNQKIDRNVLFFLGICGFSKSYEKCKMWKFWAGFRPIVVFTDPDSVEALLSNVNYIDKSTEYEFIRPMLKTGLLASAGPKWKSRRRLLTPAFHFRTLEEFAPSVDECAKVLVSRLKTMENAVINIAPMSQLCALDVICETAMGKSINAQINTNHPYVKSVHLLGEFFIHRLIRPWLWPDIIYYSLPRGREYMRSLNIVESFTRKVIRERKEELLAGEKQTIEELGSEDGTRKRREAFLDLLLRLHLENDQAFTEDDVQEEVSNFMFAGHDTTAAGIGWTLYLLGHHPEVQKRVQQEVDVVFEECPSGILASEDIKKLKYTECVIKEAQRLYPSVPVIGRELQEDTEICGYKLPKGATCMVLVYMLHRNPKIYPEPEKFNPDRFLPENCVGRHPFAYTPFSAGPRNCIGQRFALLEEKSVVANVMKNFDIKSLDPRDTLLLCPEMILRSKNGLRVKVKSRSNLH